MVPAFAPSRTAHLQTLSRGRYRDIGGSVRILRVQAVDDGLQILASPCALGAGRVCRQHA